MLVGESRKHVSGLSGPASRPGIFGPHTKAPHVARALHMAQHAAKFAQGASARWPPPAWSVPACMAQASPHGTALGGDGGAGGGGGGGAGA